MAISSPGPMYGGKRDPQYICFPKKTDAVRPLVTLMRMMRMAALGRLVHHPQHSRTASPQETPNQQGSDGEQDDVEPRRVVPCDGGLDHACMALRRDETESAEGHLDE